MSISQGLRKRLDVSGVSANVLFIVEVIYNEFRFSCRGGS